MPATLWFAFTLGRTLLRFFHETILLMMRSSRAGLSPQYDPHAHRPDIEAPSCCEYCIAAIRTREYLLMTLSEG